MSDNQALRVLVVKQMNGFSYKELQFHLLDSASYRTFCRLRTLGDVPAKSTLAENVKKVRTDTLEEVNRVRRTTGWSEAAARGALAGSIEERRRRLAYELNRYRLLLKRVIDQTERRVLKDETVSAGERSCRSWSRTPPSS